MKEEKEKNKKLLIFMTNEKICRSLKNWKFSHQNGPPE